jgi:hypothetical protein
MTARAQLFYTLSKANEHAEGVRLAAGGADRRRSERDEANTNVEGRMSGLRLPHLFLIAARFCGLVARDGFSSVATP